MLFRPANALPKLIRFMLSHFGNGLAMGSVCAVLVIQFEIGMMGALLSTDDSGLMTGLFILYGAVMFGVFCMSVAVMNLGADGAD